MRPQKLTIRNFMPFRSTDGQVYEVDFSTLDLFAITGPTGSGKSSLIDAIVWCLYGRTTRYGTDSKGVISAGENVCEVSFDFTVGSRWFRAVRRTGRTTESGLSELEGEDWVQDVSGAEQLTKRIETLLGLDFGSFTKTVILPQGEYAQFLASRPGDRRELLAKILELGVYARVSDRAKEVAGRAKTRADTIRETLHQYAGVSREQVIQKRKEWEEVEHHINEVSAQEETLRRLGEKADRAAAARSRIVELQEEERLRSDENEQVRQKHGEAETQVRAVTETLAHTVAEREALTYDPHQHERVARAVAHLRACLAAQQEAGRQGQLLAKTQRELEELTRQLADQELRIATARQVYQERIAAMQAEIAASGDGTALTEKIGQAKRWKELQQEQTRLAREQETLTRQLDAKQQALALLHRQETEQVEALRKLTQQRDLIREEEQEKKRLELEAEHLGKELQEAAREEKRVAKEQEDARAAAQAAEEEVQRQQEAARRAEQQVQRAVKALEESRRAHEVEHLRQSLRAGDPCPVCQTPVRELPPPSSEDVRSDLAALQRAAEEAQALLNRTREGLQKTNAALAVAQAKRETAERELTERGQRRREAQERFTARFSGFSSLAAALSAIRSDRQNLTETLQRIEAQAQALEKDKQSVTRQREKGQQEEATLAEALRSVTARLAENKSRLDVLAQSLACYLSAGDDPEMLLTARRQALVRIQEEIKTLEQEQRRAEEGLRVLNEQKMGKDADLRVLASQREATLAQAQREAQTVREGLALSADAALPDLAELESSLADFRQKQEQHVNLLQREDALRKEREKAEQLVAELRATLRGCERELNKTRKKHAQAAQELEQARTDLRGEIARCRLSGIGPDGEGLKELAVETQGRALALRERRSQLEMAIQELERRCDEKEQEEDRLRTAETEQRLAADLNKLLGADFMDFLSRGAVEILMHDASGHLQRLTHGRYAFDIAYKSRAIELQIVDHEDHKRKRPTHSLSGGETFLASLAIALALAQGFREVATGKAAKTSTECLILDEGFGTLDREGLQLVTETLQELRGEERRMVGIITHVEEVAAAMPMRVEVRKGSRTSTVAVVG